MVQPADTKVDNQKFLKLVMAQAKQEIKANNEHNQKCFSVLGVYNDWLQRGYINSSEVTYFVSEHDAIDYVDKFNESKGYARLYSPEK